MKVKYFHELKDSGMGNIIWADRDRGSSYYPVSRFAMLGGKFPPSHPCAPFDAPDPEDRSQSGGSRKLEEFRQRGYWASCFPEGDGITLHSLNWDKSSAEVVKDIQEVFGWEVSIGRG